MRHVTGMHSVVSATVVLHASQTCACVLVELLSVAVPVPYTNRSMNAVFLYDV